MPHFVNQWWVSWSFRWVALVMACSWVSWSPTASVIPIRYARQLLRSNSGPNGSPKRPCHTCHAFTLFTNHGMILCVRNTMWYLLQNLPFYFGLTFKMRFCWIIPILPSVSKIRIYWFFFQFMKFVYALLQH